MDLRTEISDDGTSTIYEQWQANLAETDLREQLRELFESDVYREGTYGRRGAPGRRTSVVQDYFANYRAQAWEMTLSQNPEFRRRMFQKEMDLQIREFE
jgi:hypothetical protein